MHETSNYHCCCCYSRETERPAIMSAKTANVCELLWHFIRAINIGRHRVSSGEHRNWLGASTDPLQVCSKFDSSYVLQLHSRRPRPNAFGLLQLVYSRPAKKGNNSNTDDYPKIEILYNAKLYTATWLLLLLRVGLGVVTAYRNRTTRIRFVCYWLPLCSNKGRTPVPIVKGIFMHTPQAS